MSDKFLSKLSSSYLRRTSYVRGSKFGADTRAIRVGRTFSRSDWETIFGILRRMRRRYNFVRVRIAGSVRFRERTRFGRFEVEYCWQTWNFIVGSWLPYWTRCHRHAGLLLSTHRWENNSASMFHWYIICRRLCSNFLSWSTLNEKKK